MSSAGHRGFQFGAFTLDIDRAAVMIDGADIPLRPQSFDVLQFLVENHGRLVRKEELLEAIWGKTHVTDDSLTHCLIDIRKALSDSSHNVIKTIPRRGYIFDSPVRSLVTKQRRRIGPLGFAITATVIAAISLGYQVFENVQSGNEVAAFDSQAASLYKHAKFLYHRRSPGDINSSRDYFLQAIEIEAEYADAWAGLAATYFIDLAENDAHESSLLQLKHAAEKAIAIDPNHSEGHFRLGNYYSRVGDAEAASRHRDLAFAAGPNDALILAAKAGHLAAEGNLQGAIDLMDRVIEINPLSATNRLNAAAYLLAAGKYEEAIGQAQQGLSIRPPSVDSSSMVPGFALIKLGRYQDALELAEAWPDTVEKHSVMAMAYFRFNREDEAWRAVSRMKGFAGENAWLRLAELQAFCDEIEMSFASLSAMRNSLLKDSSRSDLTHNLKLVRLSPFMSNIISHDRWDAWLTETEKVADQSLLISLRE